MVRQVYYGLLAPRVAAPAGVNLRDDQFDINNEAVTGLLGAHRAEAIEPQQIVVRQNVMPTNPEWRNLGRAYLTFRSRRFSSCSTASRKNPARGSFSSRAASTRSSVPAGRRMMVCSSLICFRPMAVTIGDYIYPVNPQNSCYHLLHSETNRCNHLFRMNLEAVMIRNTKQNWEIGQQVKVGFMTLKVIAKVPTPGDYRPDAYALESNGKFYQFVPHNGLVRCYSLEEAMAA